MSKATIAMIAAASAATGAGVSALFCRKSSQERPTAIPTAPQQQQQQQIPQQQVPLPFDKGALPSFPQKQGIVDPAGLLQYGFPGPIVDHLSNLPWISGYDRRTRNPYWVAEHITPESVKLNNGDRKRSNFYEDERVPVSFRARLNDYFRSGYDRGHQVPAADAKWSQEAMDETFALTNMCPQVGDGFNRDYWAHFEDFCRRLTQKYPSVRIVTGPLYLPKRDPADGKWRVTYEVIGNPPNVAVPTHFYKVIFAEDGKTGGNVSLGAFVLPNARIPNQKSLQDFEVPLEAIERASGLEFASKLPDDRRKKLCQEIKCEITVREFKKAALPPRKR
ncbi:nuclease [Ascosphaera atra]|nr:nuclease [Ascosphaera atra]